MVEVKFVDVFELQVLKFGQVLVPDGKILDRKIASAVVVAVSVNICVAAPFIRFDAGGPNYDFMLNHIILIPKYCLVT